MFNTETIQRMIVMIPININTNILQFLSVHDDNIYAYMIGLQ